MKTLVLISMILLTACAKGPLKQASQSRHSGGFFAPFSNRVVMDSQLVSDGQYFYFGTRTGVVFVVDSKNQRNVWKQKLSESVDTSVLVDQSKVYAGTGDGKVHALDRTNGKPLWNVQLLSPPRGNLTKVGNMILVGTNDGTLVALDQEKGSTVWKYREEPYEKMKIQFFVQGSVEKNQIFIGFPNGQLVSLDAQTGNEIWKKNIQDPQARFYDLASIVLIPNKGVLATLVNGASIMFGFDGKDRWLVKETSTQAAPILVNERILLAAKDKVMWLDLDGKEVGAIVYPRPIRPAGVAYDKGLIYVTSYDGSLHVFDEKASKWLWEYQMGISAQGAPIVLNDKIWTLNRRGQLIAMKRVH